MDAETFTERKKTLEEFYRRRKHFYIEIKQVDTDLSVYSPMSDIHFRTHIKFTRDILFSELFKNLKPVISYALSYTKLRKFYNNDFILTKDQNLFNFEYNELYIKDLEIILKTHYDFYDKDYNFYISVVAELEDKNELIVLHSQPIPEEDTKVINLFKIFKSDECIICLTNQPNIIFCNCGHLCYCYKCYKIKTPFTCPICKTDNEIIRMLE